MDSKSITISRTQRNRGRGTAYRKEFMIGFVILAAAAMIVLLFFLSGRMNTQAASATPSYKYYTSIQVQKGDTLWKIAQEYITDDYSNINDYIKEVKKINHMSSDEIRYGQYITIPYYYSEYL